MNEELFGLNHLDTQAAPALAPLGVSWSRIDVGFEGSDANGPEYNCTTGAFDPTALDQRVAAARVAGASPLLLVDYTPTCLAGNVGAGQDPNRNPPDIGANQLKWDQLVEEMALHEIEAENVTTFEVWNEPNLRAPHDSTGLRPDFAEPAPRELTRRAWWTGRVDDSGGRWRRLIRRSSAGRDVGGPRVTGRPPSANGASSFHLLWEVPTNEELVEASASLAVSTLPGVSRLYFWALQVSFGDGAGAHLGLQWGADPPRRLRHVNWGGYGPSGAELAGGASNLPSSFANPNTRDYDWEPGRPYRLRISRAAGGWDGWVDDTLVRCLDIPAESLTTPMVWSEVFADCDDPAVAVHWSGLEVVTRAGRRLQIGSVVTQYQSRRDGGCDNTSSGTDGHAFVQMTNAGRASAPGALLRVD